MEAKSFEINKLKKNPDTKQKIRVLREWVKFNLSLRGLCLKDLADKHGIKLCTLYVAFVRPYPKSERIIASAIGKRPQDLWPDRYDENGKPNRPNLWYLRKKGLWVPKALRKNITPGDEVNGNSLGEE